MFRDFGDAQTWEATCIRHEAQRPGLWTTRIPGQPSGEEVQELEIVPFPAFFSCLSRRFAFMPFFGDFVSFFGDLSPIAEILLPAILSWVRCAWHICARIGYVLSPAA